MAAMEIGDGAAAPVGRRRTRTYAVEMARKDESWEENLISKGATVPSGISRIRDIIICAAETTDSVTPEEFRAHPPVGAPERLFPNAVSEVELGDGVKLLSLPGEEADEIMNACTPCGVNFNPIRQFSQRYSFVRNRTIEEVDDSYFNPDEDGRLYDALSLSRLIRDHGFSLQYTARVVDHENGKRTIAYRASSEGAAAYRLTPGREWLDGPEAAELADLLAAQRSAELPNRVTRAMWRSEYATRIGWADVMLPTLIGGLEALLKVGRGQLTAQFKHRATAVAAELGVDGVSKSLCARMYDGRSDWVHGSHVQLFDRAGGHGATDAEEQRVLHEIATMRDLLRTAVRRAIEDPEFRAIFTDNDAIEMRWPAPRPPRVGFWSRLRRRFF
jgi:hypothetical protein